MTMVCQPKDFEPSGKLMEQMPLAKHSALVIAIELLISHTSGAAIVDEQGRFLGFVSEFDLLGAIESGKDLNRITADQLMNRDPFSGEIPLAA